MYMAVQNEQPWVQVFGTYIKGKYYDFGFNSYGKMNFSIFFPYKCIRHQIRPCHKVGQGQPRIIICANLVGPTSPMLHTKSQGHWPYGSREEDFSKVFTLYGRGGHLGHVTRSICANFLFPHHKEYPYEI